MDNNTEPKKKRTILTEEEKRERKNARQAEYAKRTGYAAQDKFNKANVKRYVVNCMVNTEQDIIEKLESVPNKMGYIKSLIREDILKNKNKKENE